MDTKQNLAQNLKLLMATTPVDHITVNQLTHQANVARNTFYYHLNTFHSLNRDLLGRFLYRVAFNMVTGVVDDLQPDCPPTLRDEMANFYGWALATQIIQWLVTNLQESKVEFYQRMHRMLNGTLQQVLDNNR